jgi:hypothetical protein
MATPTQHPRTKILLLSMVWQEGGMPKRIFPAILVVSKNGYGKPNTHSQMRGLMNA